MSNPNGRGLGRAGRGQGAVKKASSSSAPSSSSSSTSGRAVPSVVKASSSQSQVGEPKAGFPQPSSVPPAAAKATGLKAGDKGAAAIGRGGVRGRREIAVVDVVKTRPETCLTKKGDAGVRVDLLTNYFRLDSVTDWILFQYRVDFSFPEDREFVLRSWLRQHKDRLKTAYIFDGTMMFTSQRLTVGKEPITLTSIREEDHSPVYITIRLVQELTQGNAVYLQVFNILVRRCLVHLKLQLVNRNYYDPKASIQLPQHNLEIWPGYITSIRQHERNILMCAEISHKVMRTDTALKFLSECIKEGEDFKKLFQQGMIGAIVLTDYNNKTYRVDDVDFGLNPLATFKYRDNENITYVKYYKERYNLKITDMRQPLLISRASERDVRAGKDRQCLLVPELCRMTGLSSKMLDNRNLMKDLAEITRIGPETRISRLKAFNKRLQDQKEVAEDFKQWGLSVNPELLKVPGRELPQEKLFAGNRVTYLSGPDVDWTRSIRSTPMLLNGKFDTFVVICPSRLKREIEEFLPVLKRAADGMSFRIPKPIIVDTNTDSPGEMVEATERVICQYNPDLILHCFSNDRADRYSAVKKKCYVDRGVQSQVVLSRSMKSKGVMSIATKIAVQMNCKIGGIPWTVHIPVENVMVLGFDVCHNTSRKTDSVGALVASLNKSMSAWFSTVNRHSGGSELSDTLPVDVSKAIKKYQQLNNNMLPSKIFFYRDGVGEGQVNHVYQHEVVFLKKKLTEIYGGETWKLVYIIVTKRIHTRFFHDGNNPRPGTVVDDVVTLPEKYDFYLVSQMVRQGTVSPTSYNVISDNLDWDPNRIQRFTYKMTHLYFNCFATVAVPAPCQYAHKLAFMVSQNLHTQPHPKLTTSLYFL